MPTPPKFHPATVGNYVYTTQIVAPAGIFTVTVEEFAEGFKFILHTPEGQLTKRTLYRTPSGAVGGARRVADKLQYVR